MWLVLAVDDELAGLLGRGVAALEVLAEDAQARRAGERGAVRARWADARERAGRALRGWQSLDRKQGRMGYGQRPEAERERDREELRMGEREEAAALAEMRELEAGHPWLAEMVAHRGEDGPVSGSDPRD